MLDARSAVGEGPVWDPARRELLWVDIPAGLVHRLDPASGRVESLDAGQPVGAVALRADGGLVLALRDGFGLLDPDGSEVRLVRDVERADPRTRMNDGRCDGAGRFWAGTMDLGMTPGAGSLYRLDPDLHVTRLLEGLSVPNGIGWSPDGQTMYLVDSGANGVDAFDFDVSTGAISSRRRLVDVPAEAGLPDGLAIDVDGCLWVALWGGWGLRRYGPDGSPEAVVELPAAQISSCAFGGEALDELYVTSARDGLSGDEQARQPHAGGIFRVRAGVRGLPAHPFGGEASSSSYFPVGSVAATTAYVRGGSEEQYSVKQMQTAITDSGTCARGGGYAIEVPEGWNGTLLLLSRGVPLDAGDPPWDDDDPLVGALLDEGYAVAGSGGTIFWPLEQIFASQAEVLDRFATLVREPERTIAWGYSIGGIMTAGLVQVMPERLSGALALCGNLSGAVAIHNRELDIAFVVRTLLAHDSALDVVRIADPQANLALAHALLAEAQRTPEGRARLALSAAVGNVPGWHDASSPEPAADDVDERLRNQVRWYEEVGFLVFFLLRAQVDRQAGGNPSWNTGVDYSERLRRSINRDEVEALYAQAELDLEADLAILAAEPRIEADPDAVAYLERHIVFSGDLGGVPVLTVHTDGDGLVTPDNEHAYADVVRWREQEDLLRQLYVHRGGHCTFTVAEVVVALRALLARVETGGWPALEPAALNAAAAALGDERNVLNRGGGPATAAFFEYEPTPFPRQYDVRSSA